MIIDTTLKLIGCIYSFQTFVLQQITRRSQARFSIDSTINHLISLSPYCANLQHLRDLDHWETQYCFAELISDALNAPFLCQFDPFLWGLAQWNKRKASYLLVMRQFNSAILRSSFLHYFGHLVPFCKVVFMFFLKLKIPYNQGQSLRQSMHLGILILSK